MKKYIAYYRKSTDTEDRQVLSLDGQREIVKEYAKRNSLKIVAEIRESFSAKKPGRPKFMKMIQQSKRKKYDGIIAYKLDRLTRNYADLGALADLIEKGIEIHDTSYGIYKDDSNSFIMIGVNTALASAKIKGLSEDVKRGLQQKREMGWFPGYAPTGYVNNDIDKTIKIDPKRAPFVRKAFELYDTGEYSLKSLAKELYNKGFRTRSNSDHISKSTLERILKSPFYYGYFRQKGELYKGKHTPLISKALWDRVQERLDGKAQIKSGRRHVFKYRGFMTCGECGCSITAEKQKGHIYYRCTKSRGDCSQAYIREEDLEARLSEIFDPIKIEKEVMDFITGRLKELYNEDNQEQEKISKSLKIKLTLLKKEKKKLFRKMVNDQIDDQEMYNELKSDIEEKIIEISEQMSNLSQNTYDWLEQSSNLLKLANKAKKLFLQGNREEKRELLKSVSSNHVLKDGKGHYTYKKPFDILAKGGERCDWRCSCNELRTFLVLRQWKY